MSTSQFTEDQLATLTDEERAAITDPVFSEEEKAAMAGIIKEDDGESNDAEEAISADPPTTPDPAPTEDVKPEPEAKEPVVTPATADPKPVVATYQAPAVEGYDDKIKALATQQAEFDEQFKSGEMDFDEYKSKIAGLATEREELNGQKIKAEISQEMQAQTQDQLWRATVATSLARYAQESGGIDYSKDQEKSADLDAFITTLAKNPIHADKSMAWFLDEAHKRVKALHGLATDAAPTAKADPVKEAIANRKPPIADAPKTLAHVPGADGPGDVGSEFAELDKLDGEALEDALKKLSPAQREKYARLA